MKRRRYRTQEENEGATKELKTEPEKNKPISEHS